MVNNRLTRGAQMNSQKIVIMMGLLLFGTGLVQAQTPAPSTAGTKFTNQRSIAKTRPNLTQRQPAGGGPNGRLLAE